MPGVATPPQVTEPFAAAAMSPDITLPIPVPSQILITPGAASFTDGFPPLNFTDPTAGGIPPFGADMNGILYTVSAWCAFLQAGQLSKFITAVATAISGYAKGAIIAGTTDVMQLWQSSVNGNSANPDSSPATWVSSYPLYNSSAPTAGTHTDNVLPGVSDFFLDIDTTAGAITLNGFVSQRNRQRVTISNIGANPLTIGFLAGGAGNQIRANGPSIALLQNDSVTIQYVTEVTAWVVI